ncbi:hypothetical protein CALVIDRAFT_477082 [Calocera viscosa TUFC12733]|uniref:Tc1-like transposase DDE domain-containing protein n=1 Tax=Calocera viscosa (strain TUFC12733) TaxID=1330018 RepID=A0A167QE29_CALVF|nr:hypothetical protein CALVIDRAFT_477082 [Calocera viscosa TUFC12733]
MKHFFNLEHITMLDWPAYSPDLNIIENPWHEVDHHVQACVPLPTNKDQLWMAPQEEWAGLDQEYVEHLYNSMPNHVRVLLKAKGWWIKY